MKTRLTIAIAAASLASTAAFAEPRAGGVIDTIIQPEPPGIIAGINQNAPTQTISGNMYESLLRYDTDLEPMPQLAKSWEVSEDGLVYTFHLNEGVKWHDGEDFTSEDVVFSTDVYLREMNPRTRTILEHVESIEAPDEHTVVFTLKNPFGPFLLACGHHAHDAQAHLRGHRLS